MAEHLKKSITEIFQMSAYEFGMWKTYYAMYGFEQEHQDNNAAQISLTIYNMLKGEKSPNRDLQDFKIIYEGEQKEDSDNDMGDQLRAWCESFQ